jgi:hypothetical protein
MLSLIDPSEARPLMRRSAMRGAGYPFLKPVCSANLAQHARLFTAMRGHVAPPPSGRSSLSMRARGAFCRQHVSKQRCACAGAGSLCAQVLLSASRTASRQESLCCLPGCAKRVTAVACVPCGGRVDRAKPPGRCLPQSRGCPQPTGQW